MSKLKNISIIVLISLTAIGILETAEAQRKGRGRPAARHPAKAKHTVVVRHKVVVRRAHARYAHLPRWGMVVSTVPAAAIVIRTHKMPYHFHEGIYYTPRGAGFGIVRPVPGIRIKALPVGHRRVIVGPRNYYYYYGTFYTKVDASDEYETVDAPEGAMVDALPDGYEVKTIGDTEYYVLDGVYYAEVESDAFDDGVGYEVVKI